MGNVRPFSFLRRSEADMTQGNIAGHLLLFSLPLLVGNIFQQLYNMVDTWVVGNYVSNEAFSAVGTVGPIINTLIGFFTGLASGAGVVISQFYGAGKKDKVKETVHTAMCMTLILCAVFTVLGLLMIDPMLTLMKTPAQVRPESSAYLTIYFAGITGLLIYNMGAGILRAIGDSTRPFLYLVVSALLNIGLDLLFVLVIPMGVRGVAYATIISQGVSALLTVIALLRSKSCVRLIPAALSIDRDMMGKIIRVGIPAALQMAVTAFSNIFVQSYINYFGTDCMSGWTAYSKIDQLLFLPMQSLALASTTFVGQNLGKGYADRAQKGVRTAVLLSLGLTLLAMIPVMVFSAPVVAFFNNSNENVIAYGSMLLRSLTPFYLFCCFNQVYSGALRGSGNSRAPMVIMLCSFVFFRQLYLFVMANFIRNEIIPIAMGYPAGWFLCSAATLLYYRKVGLEKEKLI